MTKEIYHNDEEVTEAFWESIGGMPAQYEGKSQNQLPTDIRCAFVDFVDYLQRSGLISDELADSTTLIG